MADEAETTTRGPGRPPRARVEEADDTYERRRKRNAEAGTDPTLGRFNLTMADVDLDKFVYRSVPDEGIRLQQLTETDDYDFVTAEGAKASNADAKGVLRYRSGTNVDGSPQYTYLLRKLKKFADEDRAAKDAKVDAAEKARLAQAPDAPDQSYTPKR